MRAAWLLFLLKPILTLFSCVSAFDTERTFPSVFHALFITFPRIAQGLGLLLLLKLVCKLSFPHDAPIRTKATVTWHSIPFYKLMHFIINWAEMVFIDLSGKGSVAS